MTKFSNYEYDYTRYLNTELKEFNSSKQYQFNATNPTLDISTSCSVGILPSSTSSEIVVEINGAEPHKSYRKSRIRILAPTGSNLDANITGEGVLVSKIPLQSAEIEIQSSAEVGLAAYDLTCYVRGQGNSYFISGGGEVKIDLSGQGTIKVQGKWSDAKISLSGMGSIMTEGTCTGDYKANVSGMGNINHYGSVMGRIKRSLSGMGSINIGQ